MPPQLLSLARGGALSGALASAVISVVVLAGGLDGATPLVAIGGASGAVTFALLSRAPLNRWFHLGSWLTAGSLLVFGIASSNSWLPLAGILGAIMAAGYPLVADRLTALVVKPWLVAALVGMTVVALLVPLVVNGGTLDHDESSYALKAKSWLEGTPDTGYGFHRGPAMWVYAYVIQAIGGGEAALRAMGIVSLVGLAAATWWLARLLAGRTVAMFASVLMFASPPILRRATEFLSDIPAAALLLVCMGVVWREFGLRDAPSYRLLWILPAAWVAFYFRFQSLLSFALITVTIVVLWWPKVRRRPGPLLVAAALGVAGLVPHALFAVSETGSPIGILTWVTNAGRDFSGDGLLGYAGIFGWSMALFLGPILVGLAAWWAWRGWKVASKRARALFLLLPAGLQVFALGILGEEFERFVFFPFALLAIAGSISFQHWLERSIGNRRLAVILGLSVAVFGVVSLSVAESRRYVEARSLRNEPLELASYEVAARADGASCGIVTSYVPQVTFYSDCPSFAFISGKPESSVDRLPGQLAFAVLIEDGKRQPSEGEMATYLELAGDETIVVEGQRDEGLILTFDR